MTDPYLLRDIKASEGCKLEAYKDTNGFWTIGYGHKLPKPVSPEAWAGFTISQDVADRYLSEDLDHSLKYASSLPEWKSCDTTCRQNALQECVFNMGPGTWQTFARTRAAIEAQKWQAVHDDLLCSKWATEVQPDGLDKPGRATRIAEYFLTGQYS